MTDPNDPFKATRRLYFVRLSRAGISEKYRKRWQQENGLPFSTHEWKEEDYEKALKILSSLEPTPGEPS